MPVEIALEGKRALVTGGSRGVGRAVVRRLAAAGAEIGFSYVMHEDDARRTLDSILGSTGQPNAWMSRADTVDERDVVSLFRRAEAAWPSGFDILVPNAGIWPPEDVPARDMSFERWRRTMAVDLDGVFLTVREGIARMRDGGRIVLVGSAAGTRGEPFHIDYSAAKGALVALARALTIELAPRRITVNCVAPGWTDTEMVASALSGEGRAAIERGIPLGRIATSEDVAGAVLFFCSTLAAHVTGQVLHVAGGTTF